MKLHVHGRRGVVVAAASALAIGGLALAASAELGDFGDSTPTATESTNPGDAGGNGDDNVAVAMGKDGKDVWAIRLKVVMADGPVIDSGNAAVAAAGCTDCQTVAIAIEGVLVTGDAEVVEPVNVALALNTECTNCQTLAEAYQSVIGTDGKVRITGEGRRQIADLRRQLQQLRTSDLSLEGIHAEVNRIAGEFTTVLRTQVVPIGKNNSADTSTTTSSTPEPAGSSAPSAEPTPTESANPEPTPSS